MTIEIFTIIFIFASAYLFYIFSIKRTEKRGESAGMTKLNMRIESRRIIVAPPGEEVK
jgi:hypothetical protein